MNKINIEEITGKALEALAATFGPKWDLVKDRVGEILADRKERLTEVAKARLAYESSPEPGKPMGIDNETMLGYLKDELSILTSEAAELSVLVASEVQDLWNKTVDAFGVAINAILPDKE